MQAIRRHGQQPLYALNGHQSRGQNDRLESRLSLIRQYREYFQEALLRPWFHRQIRFPYPGFPVNEVLIHTAFRLWYWLRFLHRLNCGRLHTFRNNRSVLSLLPAAFWLLPVPLPYRSKDTPVLVLQGFLHRHDKYLHAVSDNTDRRHCARHRLGSLHPHQIQY